MTDIKESNATFATDPRVLDNRRLQLHREHVMLVLDTLGCDTAVTVTANSRVVVSYDLIKHWPELDRHWFVIASPFVHGSDVVFVADCKQQWINVDESSA